MRKILDKRFFNRNAVVVARDLIGKYLVGKTKGKTTACKITETEAYDGPKDKASHASRGKTARNAVMFGEAGRFYVYFVYGFHHMINIVTDKKGYPSAVLIRGLEGVNGPGRLTKKLKITRSLNNKPANQKTGLWFEDRPTEPSQSKALAGKGVKVKKSDIKKTPRIGVSYAGPVWSEKLYRFVLKDTTIL